MYVQAVVKSRGVWLGLDEATQAAPSTAPYTSTAPYKHASSVSFGEPCHLQKLAIATQSVLLANYKSILVSPVTSVDQP